ncbi:MAG: NfeD family protein [Soonwooa sp.]
MNQDSGYKGQIWLKKGEKVKVISISGNAVIVEKTDGKRFPCNIKDLE